MPDKNRGAPFNAKASPQRGEKNPRFACTRDTCVRGEQMKKMYEYESSGEGIEAEERIEASKSGGMKGDPGARVVDLCSKSSHCRPCAVRDVSQVFSFPT